jgi:enoyl-CoA hydratase/carnithine racemase
VILSGEPVDTAAALRWGLVHEVVPAAELDAAVENAIEGVFVKGARELTARRRAMVGA